jgi:hypothetical protein
VPGPTGATGSASTVTGPTGAAGPTGPAVNTAAFVTSTTTGIAGADQITNMVSMTQAEYNALATKNATTFYVITG